MLGGKFTTNRKALLDFKFPELNQHKTVNWICHVDDKMNKDKAMYDMIVGMDLMCKIGILVDTENKTIWWEQATTMLCQKGELYD